MGSEGYSILFVCHPLAVRVYVSDTTLLASVVDQTLKFQHQQNVNDTLECFDSWILKRMLRSRDIMTICKVRSSIELGTVDF